MFKLNRKVEYALIALKHMVHKRPGELTTAKEIADTYGCSFDTIARVLQIMAQKNWLQSSHGSTGGYLIVKDLGKVSFYDLSEALLGPMKLVRCISASCKIKSSCNIVSPVQNLNQHLIELYQDLSVHQLLLEETNSIKKPTRTSSIHDKTPSPHGTKEINL
jgi:Rrf2 family protein